MQPPGARTAHSAGSPLRPGASLAWLVGIEDTCVYPRPRDGFEPLDEHRLTGHDVHWESDAELVARLGASGLRYGMSWPAVHTGWDRYEWHRLDGAIECLAGRHGLWLIADLVHYGCPPWLEGSFLDERFVEALSQFTDALLDRYRGLVPAVTPINEPLTTASFCGLRRVWPPAVGTWTGWARVAVALAEAFQEVSRVAERHSVEVVHVEAGHDYETYDKSLLEKAALLNQLGYLPTDLAFGRLSNHEWAERWLARHGIKTALIDRLTEHSYEPDYLGLNYYPDLTPRVLVRHNGQVAQLTANRAAAGLARLIRDRAERYGLPIVVTETSIEGDDDRRLGWLEEAATEVGALRADGVDVRGLTWWPLIDFVDWSVIAAGGSVEEFLPTRFDDAARELVVDDAAIDVPATRIRRMGLLRLGAVAAGSDPDGAGAATRTETAASARYRELASAPASAGEPSRLWPAGAAFDWNEGSVVNLDGAWQFRPGVAEGCSGGERGGDDEFEASGEREAQEWHQIDVPAVWEAQGFVDLDGAATYRRSFTVPDTRSHWTLRFDAVMDSVDVRLNGVPLGVFDLAFTPFEIDVSGLLNGAENLIEAVVMDPPAGSEAHVGKPHGKQGWANNEFPSPPSMYLTYGGIWQSVALRQHGPVAARDLWSNLDPDDLIVFIELHNIAAEPATATVAVEFVPVDAAAVPAPAPSTRHRRPVLVAATTVEVAAGARRLCSVGFGRVGLDRWSPQNPRLYRCSASVSVREALSDAAAIDVGLRTVAADSDGLVLNGEPFIVKSALVQGFAAERLYADGSLNDIVQEVTEAKRLGFNTLRLHLRAFPPDYLRVCDRLGMLLHCDIGVGEPMSYDQLDGEGPVARACTAALSAQVRRDRRHPSIVLWSCMNEIGLNRPSFLGTGRYRAFVTAMAGALSEHDPTRPFIENDWLEPDEDRVAANPTLLTAHWYGHLSRDYLATVTERCGRLASVSRPVLVSEFGDWGLPEPGSTDGQFYSHRAAYESQLADAGWTGSLEDFSRGTQLYQGVADRLQIDIFRRNRRRLAGYCLTELTDVPLEFNGVLDIRRRPKLGTEQVRQANQEVSPMLALDDFGAFTASPMVATAWIANDSRQSRRVDVDIEVGRSRLRLGRFTVQAKQTLCAGTVKIPVHESPGEATLAVRASDDLGGVWNASYPIMVHAPPEPGAHKVALAGLRPDSRSVDALRAAGAEIVSGVENAEVLVVAEHELTDSTAAEAVRSLEGAGLVLVLAQPPKSARLCPTDAILKPVVADWGGTPFRFTGDDGTFAAFPPATVLHIHDADIAPDAVLVTPDTGLDAVAVGMFKPLPRPATGAVVAAVRCLAGTVVYCQYKLQDPIASGSPTAMAVLSSVLAWAKAQQLGVPAR